MSVVAVHTVRQRDLSRRECLELLRGEHRGRLAFSSEGLVEVIPVAFALENGRIALDEARAPRLSAGVGQVVTLQCDAAQPRGEHWSACATGYLTRLEGRLFLEAQLFSGFSSSEGWSAAS